MRVAITGASGLIGRALVELLEAQGHDVERLVRRPADRAAGEIFWNPATGEIDRQALEGVDAVVHLAGANVGAGRWTPARRRAIRDSRMLGTRLLSETLADLKDKPAVLVAASAIGYYGDRVDQRVDEASGPGRGFLASVCRDWEAATAPAARAGIRVVNGRVGVVLSARGGALEKMLTPFKLGLGGPVGGGDQVLSWISLHDVVGAMAHLLVTDSCVGPVNLVAPQPVTNRAFARALGRVLRRPVLLPLPALVVRALFGEMGRETVLAGARVSAAKLVGSGYAFRYPELEGALRAELAPAPAVRAA